jgi:hypothetical protein
MYIFFKILKQIKPYIHVSTNPEHFGTALFGHDKKRRKEFELLKMQKILR